MRTPSEFSSVRLNVCLMRSSGLSCCDGESPFSGCCLRLVSRYAVCVHRILIVPKLLLQLFLTTTLFCKYREVLHTRTISSSSNLSISLLPSMPKSANNQLSCSSMELCSTIAKLAAKSSKRIIAPEPRADGQPAPFRHYRNGRGDFIVTFIGTLKLFALCVLFSIQYTSYEYRYTTAEL